VQLRYEISSASSRRQLRQKQRASVELGSGARTGSVMHQQCWGACAAVQCVAAPQRGQIGAAAQIADESVVGE